jgi:hypothetical protein
VAQMATHRTNFPMGVDWKVANKKSILMNKAYIFIFPKITK